MTTAQLVSLLGGVAVATAVKFSNMLTAKVSKILGVNPPEPIPEPDEDDEDKGA